MNINDELTQIARPNFENFLDQDIEAIGNAGKRRYSNTTKPSNALKTSGRTFSLKMFFMTPAKKLLSVSETHSSGWKGNG